MPTQTVDTQMHMTAPALETSASPSCGPAAGPAFKTSSLAVGTSKADALASAAAAALKAEVTDPTITGASAVSPAAIEAAATPTAAAAMPTAAAATPPLQAAAAKIAAEQLQTGLSHHYLTAAAPAASAAVSASTCLITPAAGEASADRGQDVIQQSLFTRQPIPTPAEMQDTDSVGIQASCGAQTAVATAVGHSCGILSFSRACPADSAPQPLGRDASIAQVLASLNRLPTYSIPGQQARHAQLVPASCSKLPPQSYSAQQRSECLQLQMSPHQAVAAQLGHGALSELPQAVCATQPLSPVSRRHVTQQLSLSELSPLPQQVHAHAAQPSELQGVTQPLSPAQLRAANQWHSAFSTK